MLRSCRTAQRRLTHKSPRRDTPGRYNRAVGSAPMIAMLLGVGLLFASPQHDARSATASVSGSVLEAVSRAVIPNARVTLVGAGVRESITADNDGRFTFAGLSPGR